MTTNNFALTGATAATTQYKYATNWTIYPHCPPHGLVSAGIQCYRVVHADLTRASNFQPPAVITPARLSTWTSKACCEAYALSVFDSLNNLKAHVTRLQKSNRNVRKVLGSHYCQLSVNSGDGRISPVNTHGHINFFEFISFNATSVVTQHAVLP